MDPVTTNLAFTDAELNALNEIVRSHKISISNEELVLLMMGKRSTPLAELTVKVGTAWEKRTAEAQNPQAVKAEQAPNIQPLSAE